MNRTEFQFEMDRKYYQKTEGEYCRAEGLKAAKRLVRALELLIKNGSVTLENPRILFGHKSIKFTTQEYFKLAKRALDESIGAAVPKEKNRNRRENY